MPRAAKSGTLMAGGAAPGLLRKPGWSAHPGALAQWQSSGLLIRGFRVRAPGAPLVDALLTCAFTVGVWIVILAVLWLSSQQASHCPAVISRPAWSPGAGTSSQKPRDQGAGSPTAGGAAQARQPWARAISAGQRKAIRHGAHWQPVNATAGAGSMT